MIYRLIDLPSNVIGFKAQWDVSEKDLEEVFIPIVQEQVEKTGKLNCLIILNTSVKHLSRSILRSIKYFSGRKVRRRRIAILSESRSIRLLVKFLNALFKGEFRVFSITQLEKAIEWTSRKPKALY